MSLSKAEELVHQRHVEQIYTVLPELTTGNPSQQEKLVTTVKNRFNLSAILDFRSIEVFKSFLRQMTFLQPGNIILKNNACMV